MTIQKFASFEADTTRTGATSKLAKAWEAKNAKRAVKASGATLMALSLSACGGSDVVAPAAVVVVKSDLTVKPDTISASGDVTAARAYTPGGNDLVNTLQTDDVVTGVAGTAQALTVTFGNNNDAGGATVAPTIKNIETINFNNVSSNAAVDTLDMSNVTGVTTVNVSSLSDDTVIRGLDDVAIALKAYNVSDEAADIAFEFDDTAVDGTSDAASLTVDNFAGNGLNVGAGATAAAAGTGVETLNLVASGTASTIASLGSSSVTELNVNATADLTVTAVTSAVIDTVNFAVEGEVSTADTSINVGGNIGAQVFAYTGGTGDDTLIATTGFTGTDSLDAGEGTADVFSIRPAVASADITVGALDASLAAVATGWDTLDLRSQDNGGANAIDFTVDMDVIPGVTAISMRAGDTGTATVFTLNDLSAAQAGALSVSMNGTGATTASDATLNLDMKVGTGTADSAAITFTTTADDGTAANAQTLTISDTNDDIESLSVTLSGAYDAILAIDATSFATSLTVTGGSAGDSLTTSNNVANTTVDFGGVASNLVGLTTSGSTQTVTTGSGNDIVTLDTGAKTVTLGAGNDTLDGNATLNETVAGVAVADTINGGEGTDTLVVDAALSAAFAANISNFERIQADTASANHVLSSYTANSGFTLARANAASVQFTNAGAITQLELGASSGTAATLTRLVDGSADTLDIETLAAGLSFGTGITVSDEETITIDVADGELNVNSGTFTATDLVTLTVSGDWDVDLGTVTSTAIAAVDLSNLYQNAAGAGVANDEGDFIASFALSAADMTVTGNSASGHGGIINVTTGSGDDTITGTVNGDTIVGGSGDDTITGLGGVDTITGGRGSDTIVGGTGADNILYVSLFDGGTSGDSVSGFVSTSDNIIIDGALETAVDLSTGVTALVTVTQAIDGTAVTAALETTELLFLDREMNIAETNSVTVADLDDLALVAALVDEAFTQTDGAGVVARTIMVAIESSDVAGTFGLYTYVQSADADVTFNAAEFSHLATVVGDDLVAGDITF